MSPSHCAGRSASLFCLIPQSPTNGSPRQHALSSSASARGLPSSKAVRMKRCCREETEQIASSTVHGIAKLAITGSSATGPSRGSTIRRFRDQRTSYGSGAEAAKLKVVRPFRVFLLHDVTLISEINGRLDPDARHRTAQSERTDHAGITAIGSIET